MIWQETGEVGIVVMLTQMQEQGREKCCQYYPKDMESAILNVAPSDEEIQDDFRATVELLESEWIEATRSTMRKLKLTSSGDSKIIWHYLFEGWPDFATPEDEDRAALLELIKDSFTKADLAGKPRIIHCSAGVGRTGTFIALDHLLAELDEGAFDRVPDEKDPITDLVNDLRKQRMMMVQGESQYHFLFSVLKEQWLKRHGMDLASN